MTKIAPNLATLPATWILTDEARHASLPAFIQNHSYNQYAHTGATCSDVLYDGKYSLLSRNFDRAVRDSDANGSNGLTPITLTVSAGNIHQQSTQFAGCTDRRLTLPPATAKNVIALGASESVRGTSEQWTCSTATPPTRAESFNNIEGDSKRGTSAAGWYKPDLFSPGSLIFVPRSTETPTTLFCPGAPLGVSSSGDYVTAVGTSFAAPAGAGAAALAERVYAETISPACHPSCPVGSAAPALAKAMLIMSARSMRDGEDRAEADPWKASSAYSSGSVIMPRQGNGHRYAATTGGSSASSEPAWPTSGSIADGTVTWAEAGSTLIGSLPNNRQGFGRLHLEDLLSAYPARDYVNETASLSSLQSWTKTYRIHDTSLPVKIVLAWSDVPALESEGGTSETNSATTTSPLLNDLNLAVDLGSPCTTRYIGNRTTFITPAHGEESQTALCTDVAYDTANNVELVKFFGTSGTQFTVKVTAASGSGSQTFALVAYNAYDSAALAPPAAPSGFLAAGASGGAVSLTWSAVSGASSYEIQRQSGGAFFSTVAIQTGTTFSESVTASTGYLYRVRAKNATGVSPFVSDFATTVAFTDGTLTAGTTAVKAVHVNELRAAINLDRVAVGLSPYTFADSPADTSTRIMATHINQLRSAMNDALAVAGITFSYTDPSITSGSTAVKATHIDELRGRVQ